jgi:two-component system alkaline phosphatase synthesis response regulator PhoP
MTSRVQDMETIVLDTALVLDLAHQSVRRGSAIIPLSELEWGIVSVLLASARPLSTQELLAQVWHDPLGDPRLVWSVMGRLRRKLEPDPRQPRVLCCNRSFGYWLVIPLEGSDATPKR